MKSKDRQKICAYCEGRIPIEATECIYCGIGQSDKMATNSTAQTPLFKNQSLQDSLTSLYTPPYSQKAKPEYPFAAQEKKASYEKIEEQPDEVIAVPPVEAKSIENAAPHIFWPTMLLSLGSNLLIIGLLQLFFSSKGLLKLEWDSRYWFIYCLASLPLFLLGIRKIKSFE